MSFLFLRIQGQPLGRLKNLLMRPHVSTKLRRAQGTLDIHDNGFRYSVANFKYVVYNLCMRVCVSQVRVVPLFGAKLQVCGVLIFVGRIFACVSVCLESAWNPRQQLPLFGA